MTSLIKFTSFWKRLSYFESILFVDKNIETNRKPGFLSAFYRTYKLKNEFSTKTFLFTSKQAFTSYPYVKNFEITISYYQNIRQISLKLHG